MTIAEDIQCTLQYGKELLTAAARGGLDALAQNGSPLEAEPCAISVGAAVGAALGMGGVALTRRRKSPLALLAGGVVGAAVAAGFVMAWQQRKLAGCVVRGGIEGSRPVRDAHWLAQNPIDYA